MKKYLIFAGILLILFLFLFFLRPKTAISPVSQYGNEVADLRVGSGRFSVEIVSSSEKTALGLSGRDSMCGDCGMLFVFENEARRGFWMKDMKFDLDIVWIAGDRIVFIAKNVSHEPGKAASVRPEEKADKVLELNAGTSDWLGLKAGDPVKFE